MSTPQDSRASLLSGYLDGILSPAERRQAEQLLESDREAAAYLDSLRSMRDSIRQLSQTAEPGLGADFSTRVIEAAVTRARAEGLADEHPLIRLAEQPTGTGGASDREWLFGGRFRPPLRLLAGLAASILIAAVLMRGWVNAPQAPRVADQAHSGADQAHSGADQASTGQMATGESELAPSGAARPSADTATASDSGAAPGMLAEDLASADPPLAPPPDSSPRMALDPALVDPAPSDIALSDIALSDLAPAAPEALGPEATAAAGGVLNAILALEVRQTPDGRARKVLRNAIRRAGLEAARPQAGLVDAAKQTLPENEAEDAEQISVIYLKGPAKTLDRLIMALLADRQGVESIGWNLVLDPPVLQAVATAARTDPRADPRAVRHESPLWIPIDDADQWATITETLGDRGFLPWDEGDLSPLGLSMPTSPDASEAAKDESGPDIPAEILLLVRP